MPQNDSSCRKATSRAQERHIDRHDPADVYYLDTNEGDTTVRQRGKTVFVDTRRLDEIAPIFRKHGFLRIS